MAPDPSASSAKVIDRLARAIADLEPKSVLVVDDPGGLAAALATLGVEVTPRGGAVSAPADLAVLTDTTAPLPELLAGPLAGVRRLLVWRADGRPLSDVVTVAATHHYFRSPHRSDLADFGGVLLEVGEPSTTDLVARYEAALGSVSALERQITQMRHQLLTARDHAIGTDAELTRLRRAQDQRVDELMQTNTWRVGNRIVGPLARLKTALRR